jgi:hypothetical protein
MTPQRGPSWLRQSGALTLQAFTALSAFAEGLQSVILIWATFQLSHDAFLVSVMLVLGYAPSAVLGLAFARFADGGASADRLHLSNLTLALFALLPALLVLRRASDVALVLVGMGVAQVALSLAKMVNKSAVHRVVRGAFDQATGARLLAAQSSITLIAQTAGAGLAGVFLSTELTAWGLLLAALAYGAAGLTALRMARPEAPAAVIERPRQAPARPALQLGPGLLSVLLFSVPSSGGLQFANAILAPFADGVARGDAGFFSLVNMACLVASAGVSMLLSAGYLSMRGVLTFGLPVMAAAAGLMSLDFRPALALVFAVTLIAAATAHVVSMQVKANQVPPESEVGSFVVTRTAVVSVVKAGYSLAAGFLVNRLGVGPSLLALGASVLPFALAWLYRPPRWKEAATHGGTLAA